MNSQFAPRPSVLVSGVALAASLVACGGDVNRGDAPAVSTNAAGQSDHVSGDTGEAALTAASVVFSKNQYKCIGPTVFNGTNRTALQCSATGGSGQINMYLKTQVADPV